MEERYQIALDSLKKKIEIIISKYESLYADNLMLSERLEKYRQNLDTSNNKIKDLEQKIDNLQLIEAFKTSSGDVREAKHNIGKLVREIDKCIALLND